MELYKYINSQFLDNALHSGTFRLGTLYDYQDEEKYGSEIGDFKEGTLNLHVDSWKGKEVDLSSNEPEAELIRSSLNKDINDPWCQNKIRFGSGTRMTFERRAKNALLFCASKNFDKAVMKSFGCDSCILIKDANQFFKAITSSISDYSNFVSATSVIYSTRDQILKTSAHIDPAFLKPQNYAHQNEYRALWEFKPGLPISPVIVNAIDCSKYIERFR